MNAVLRIASLITFVATGLEASSVYGAPAGESDRTELLYREAREAFEAGDFDKACPAFREYHRLTGAAAALFTLAECEMRWGKPARAFGHYSEFLERTKDVPATPVQEQRRRIASEQINELSKRVGRLQLSVASGIKGSTLLKLDGDAVPVPVTEPILVDPGEHTLELLAESGPSERRRVIVGAGETRRIELGSSVARSGLESHDTQNPAGQRTWTAAPIVLAGVGAAGLVTSLVFGGLALDKKGDVDALCVGNVCTPEGKNAADSAQTLAGVATASFAVGVVGLASAIAVYLLAPKP